MITYQQAEETLAAFLSGEALDRYLRSRPGRCPECGYHPATQGHRPGPRWFAGLEPWKDSEVDPANGCSQWTPPRLAGLGPDQCKDCGELREDAGLITRCRDWHETCPCGVKYSQPKGQGCRRRKHVKVELAA
jgi:hypothetical protein